MVLDAALRSDKP